jgi:hypothetical protein
MNDPLRFRFGDQSCSASLRAAGTRASSRNHIQPFWLAMTLSAVALLAPLDRTPQPPPAWRLQSSIVNCS